MAFRDGSVVGGDGAEQALSQRRCGGEDAQHDAGSVCFLPVGVAHFVQKLGVEHGADPRPVSGCTS